MMLHLIHDKKEGEKVPTEKIEVNRTEKPHVHRTQKIMRRRKKIIHMPKERPKISSNQLILNGEKAAKTKRKNM